MTILNFKMKKNEMSPWEKRYLRSTNTMLFGKPKRKSRKLYIMIIVLILLLGFLFN
jgi:hypothetical protein